MHSSKHGQYNDVVTAKAFCVAVMYNAVYGITFLNHTLSMHHNASSKRNISLTKCFSLMELEFSCRNNLSSG